MAQKHVQGVINFFKGEHWNNFITNHLSYPDSEKEFYHSHIYVDMSVHPKSMHPIMYAFWKKKGYPLERSIDPQSPKPHQGGLHGCAPAGVTNFDFFFRYNKDAILEAMPIDAKEAEHGHNALSWGKEFQDNFTKQFQFRNVGPREVEQIKAWFRSKHWKECLEHAMEPTVTHCHCNVELNFDPGIIIAYAVQDLATKGWVVERAYPSVYDVKGTYTGKTVYLVGHPEKVFDICWKYNPDVTIQRATEGWIFDTPGFDNWHIDSYNKVIDDGDFYVMTQDEINEVIASF